MRASGLWCVAAWVVCLLPMTASAQNTAQRRAAVIAASEDQTEPYHKHRDIRHGHDHYYPDRGAIVRDLPVGTIGTSYAGVSYRYHDGIWLEPHGPAYMVVAPPVGLIAPTLPLYSTVVTHGSDSFLYCNDTYYRPRPDLGGYEVVNDPTLETGPAPPAEPEALVGGRMPSAPVAGPTAPAAPGVGAGAATSGAAALVGGATPASTAAAPAIATPLGAASVSPPAGGTAVPIVAREALPREASFSGGAMPGANTGTVRLGAATSGGETSASVAATPSAASAGVATPSSATPSSSAAAASVPAASLGTSAGTGAPAAPAGAPAAGTPKVPKVFLYPKNGQSADQQARDRYDCYRFAVTQSGFDPLRTSGSAPAPASEQQSDFDRAQGACFEGRGYSNR